MATESQVKYQEEESVHIPVQVKTKRAEAVKQSSLGELMEEDRFWATLAHALGPIMMGFILFTDSPAWLLALMLTAGIYLYHSNKSPYVRMHARQALMMQLMGTFGWFILILSGLAVWLVALMISIILMIVLIGFVLTPLVLVAGPILFVASFLLPLSVILFGTIGAWETWHNREFRYPYLADSLDKYLGAVAENTTQEVAIV